MPGTGEVDREVQRIAEVLSGYRFRFSSEEELQDGIARVLEVEAIQFEREHVLDVSSRLDFYLPLCRLGIEAKVDGSVAQAARQLLRYAQHEAIAGLVLVSSRMKHRQVPRELNGKPIAVVTRYAL